MNNEPNYIKSSPRDVFVYLLATAALYFSVYAILNILFNIIESRFPDPLNPYYEAGAAVRWSLSMIVVIFPVYIWLGRFLYREMRVSPEKSSIKIRKWLLYLTVFLSAALLIGDLVTLIYNFLQGDLTVPFVIKVVAVFSVGAAVFWYYLYNLKRSPQEFSAAAKIFSWFIIVAVTAVVVAGFFIAGSPFRNRLLRFDSQKISNLEEIQWRIVNFWQQKGILPVALSDLRDDISGFIPQQDPQTKEPYEYRQTGKLSFELCANFNLPSEEKSAVAPYRPVGTAGENWSHGAGKKCFSRTIDQELYPRTPTKK